MRRATDGFDPQHLTGREVESVLYATNLAALHLSNGIVITALAPIGHTERGVEPDDQHSVPWQDARLLAVIGQAVVSASVEETGRLVVRFGGDTLVFTPDESGYESFIVEVDGEEWFG